MKRRRNLFYAHKGYRRAMKKFRKSFFEVFEILNKPCGKKC